MANGTFFGDDIDIYLDELEVISMGELNFNWDDPVSRISRASMDVDLENNLNESLIARIHVMEFESLGDGIRVERTDYGFLVNINSNAYWRMRDSPLSGTRYDGCNKINFHCKK